MYQLRSHMAGEQLELLESSIAETSAKKEKPANPMFKATMNDARLFRNLIGAISSLIEEADFNATPEGIKLRSMDPSHIAMVDFEWPKTAFDTYECSTPTRLRLSVSNEMDKGSDAILEIDLRPETDPKTGQPAATTTPARATYNLNYLGEIIRAGSGASEVTSLEFSTNMPIKVEFEMPQQGRLLYYLAPRIEAE